MGHHVRRHRRPPLQGADRARAGLDEGQDHRAARAQVLGVDRRLDPLVALDLPADVDLEAGVRRVGPLDRPPQVLLSAPAPASNQRATAPSARVSSPSTGGLYVFGTVEFAHVWASCTPWVE